MRIKRYNEYLIEAISGWELIGTHMGPNYPEQPTDTMSDVNNNSVILGSNGNLYTHDDYIELYHAYLKDGHKPLNNFSKGNLDIVLSTIKK